MEEWSRQWIDQYTNLIKWIRPYINTSVVNIKEVDVFAIWPYVEIKLNRKESFVFLDKRNFYYFHVRSGYLVHIFSPYAFKFSKKRFGEKIIQKVDRPEPGRRIVYAERIIEGPRGGKLFALGSATHISTDPIIVRNKLTRRYLLKVKDYAKQNKLAYPNIYVVEKKMPSFPFYKIFNYAIQIPWPEWPIR